jgi:glutathione S-transferase
MKLYYTPGACSLAPHIALREAGLQFDLDKVDLGTKKTASGEDFLKANPKGYVPALRTTQGNVLTEASVLVQYVADQKPEANLAPKLGTMERYQMMEWLNFIATELHKGFGPLWNPNAPAETKEAAKTNLFKRFDTLEAHFANNDYLLGKQFTVADAYLFTVMNWANFHKLDMSKWSKLGQYLGRVAARPKVQEALKAEGLMQ